MVVRKKKYSRPYDDVYASVKNALKDVGFNVESESDRNDIREIKASTGSSLRSWGESITVTVKDLDDEIEVSVNSSAKAQLFDWGKSSENVNRVFKKLDKILK